MNHSIRGSDVFIKNDLRAILDGLDIAARHQPSGCFRDGWLSATNAMRASIGIEAEQAEIVTVERYERYERIEQRRQAPAERQFKIVGEREEWAPPPVDMSGDDVNITLFNPACGRLVTREIGHAWFGNDGTTTYWNAGDWQRVPTEEAQAWGELVPDGYGVLMRHAYANAKRRQLTANRRMLR